MKIFLWFVNTKKKLGLILCMVAMNFAHIVLYHTQEEKKDRVDPKILSTR